MTTTSSWNYPLRGSATGVALISAKDGAARAVSSAGAAGQALFLSSSFRCSAVPESSFPHFSRSFPNSLFHKVGHDERVPIIYRLLFRKVDYRLVSKVRTKNDIDGCSVSGVTSFYYALIIVIAAVFFVEDVVVGVKTLGLRSISPDKAMDCSLLYLRCLRHGSSLCAMSKSCYGAGKSVRIANGYCGPIPPSLLFIHAMIVGFKKMLADRTPESEEARHTSSAGS